MVAMLADIFTFTTGRTQVIHPVELSTEMSQNRCYNDVSTFLYHYSQSLSIT